ncbi:MAG: rhodanese-like domain-containing protein [Planctomycetes bacterium]|nr:rhodanese-like domain-containing protein [Planctomycetota bacterium]
MNKVMTQIITLLVIASALGAATNSIRPTSMPWMRAERINGSEAVTNTATTPKVVPVEPKRAGSGSVANAVEPAPAAPAAGPLTAEDVLLHLKNGSARFVDAREQHEWVEGHFRSAIHIPASAIYANIDRIVREVPPNEKIIVYCGGGDCEASHHVADALKNDFKYQDVTVYVKGWQEVDSKMSMFASYVAKGD